MLKFLLKRGADITAVDDQNKTPLESVRFVSSRNLVDTVFRWYSWEEWRPWNHSNYPPDYRTAIRTLMLTARVKLNE